MTVAVLGATGFIGRSIVWALERRGHIVRPIQAPRIHSTAETVSEVERDVLNCTWHVNELGQNLQGVDAVVNAAGVGDAEDVGGQQMIGANAVLPRCIQDATLGLSGSVRLLHVSSAAVLGTAKVLTSSSNVDPFSPYSRSKSLGELGLATDGNTVILRPTSVHGEGRNVTKRLAQVARSSWSSIAGDGTNPSPQALVENVGDAIAALATMAESIPRIVVYPWEGLTARTVLTSLGNGREPTKLPSTAANLVVRTSRLAGRASPRARANSRRLEMMWFGQKQEESWLTGMGWRPPFGLEYWHHLGAVLADQQATCMSGESK